MLSLGAQARLRHSDAEAFVSDVFQLLQKESMHPALHLTFSAVDARVRVTGGWDHAARAELVVMLYR